MADDANVWFTHPTMPSDLQVFTNPDLITWAYGLNTQSYPTYGGEVIQILSVYFDDMTISGTVRTVAELEVIYSWFIAYMQIATQGRDGGSFNQRPVQFHYPERGWVFDIWPKSLPGFAYGRDIVAPTWTVTAAVKEPDAAVANQIKSVAAYNASATGQLAPFGSTTANFGDTGNLTTNPWTDVAADPARHGEKLSSYIQSLSKTVADTYNNFLTSYASGNLDSLPQFADISAPTSKDNGSGAKSTRKKGPKTS